MITVYDYINYATIHNTTIPSSPILTPPTLTLLSSLANTHEYHLAYNATSPVRAIAGATLAAEILAALNGTVTGNSSTPLFNIQLGAYGYFLSFFGLAGLTSLPPSTTSGDSFEGIPDYTSAMTFELVTNASVVTGSLPAEKDISVRFLWHNGTTSNRSTPVAYPLFGQPEMTLPWVKFVAGMSAFAVGTGEAWCGQCGGCDLSRSAVDGGQGGGGGISRAVAGVIGALVTLVVVMGVEVGVLVGAGLRVGRRKGMGEGSGEGMGKEGGG